MARISLKQWAKDEGLPFTEDGKIKRAELEERLEECVYDGTCPALCDEGCEVEPDGTCPHGAPSVLLAVGVI